MSNFLTSCFLLICFASLSHAADQIHQSEKHTFSLVTVSEQLNQPWGFEFLPDGQILVTEKPGKLRVIKNGKLLADPIEGLPKVTSFGQGGLMDVVAHPNFKNNHWIYFAYTSRDEKGTHTSLARAVLKDNKLSEIKIFFTTQQVSTGVHYGSRMVFDKNNYLYVTVGDHGRRHQAQKLTSLTGSVLRFKDDGSIPADNPFVKQKDAQAAIFTYGNRNPQGIAIDQTSGLIWEAEFAPQGGDEVNILTAGTNYGWPVITYGEEYGGGKIGQTHKEGMAQPVKYWIPSINPSGINFYTGDKFPHWQGNLFMASLRGRLVRLTIKDKQITAEEHIVKLGDRIRHVKQGPDQLLYFVTDGGKFYMLKPAKDTKK